ncbi:hypothetical protein Vretimale_17752 [Volvox reticuliferus]|uniref:Uncharacterized protein n=1 Tax=Volvox reticuliferus TaxID=1737510 RepID=A0A8J4LYP9_9CHLO|nr:hypothetical protein Vretifemale_18990 [Volvox reticuliferus]GIM14878.1 hypothetical protein Vretimale_17752 [Volvox reticuliferus]
MAHCMNFLSLVLCVLAVQYATAQDLLGKTIPTDALFSNVKKDAIHGHLQRMLQMDIQREELEIVEDCSPAGLIEEKKCVAQSVAGSKLSSTSNMLPIEATRSAPNCKGPDCLVAPMPGEKLLVDLKATGPERQVSTAKFVPYGPMTQDSFERMVQRKRAALREELQKKGSLTAELEAFLQTSGTQLKDAFGIPLPAGPSEPRPRDDFEMRFQPQAPSPDPAIKLASTSASSDTPKATSTSSSSDRGDFEMRFEPQTPAMDPNALRSELKAFIAAASPAPQHAIQDSTTVPPTISSATTNDQSHTANATSTVMIDVAHPTAATANANTSLAHPELESGNQPEGHQRQKSISVLRDAGVPTSGPARPPMTEQEAARLASQQAANAAARDAALARKRQMVLEEHATGKTASVKHAAAVSTSASLSTSQPKSSSDSQQRRRSGGNNLSTKAPTGRTTSKAKSGGAATRTIGRVSSSSWSVINYLSVAVLLAVLAFALFVMTAVMEDALLARPTSVRNGAGMVALPTQWLALAHSLWRRCRRAFTAARKQLTGHCSDLPMSANEGSGPISRAVAAATVFAHVFWSHLSKQQFGGAVSAAFDASRRTSTGSALPDRLSAGGAAAVYSSPFAAPQFQQFHGTIAPVATPSMSYVIEADGSAAATAAMELNLRRRH